MRLRTFILAISLHVALLALRAAGDAYDPPANYYAAATGTGATLKGQLLTIMSTGQMMRSYGDFRDSAILHDADPAHPGNILLVYNRASVPGVWSTNPLVWNREHVWPQARQPGDDVNNGTTGSKGDPHVLRPANEQINQQRGDKPFGYATTTGSYGDAGDGFYFPGNADRGDVARALFYNETRYASTGLSLDDDFPSGYEMGDLESLVAWNFLDPPDDFERRRNQVIYSQALNPQFYTNNRNAYIDNPEFVWSAFVDDANDSQIGLGGAVVNTSGSSGLAFDFGRRLVGSTASQSVTINKTGVDGTYIRVTPGGQATSTITGKFNAFAVGAPGNKSATLGLPAGAAGLVTGTVTIDNLDVTMGGGDGHGGKDANDTVSLTSIVLDHANSSFTAPSDLNLLTHNFGTVAQGSTATFSFDIFNLPATASYTAGLDLDSVVGSGHTSVLTTNLATFGGGSTLAAADHRSFVAMLNTAATGMFSASYTLSFSDENLPGAAALGSLTLQLSGTVQAGPPTGDFDQDGMADGLDFLAWQRGVGLTSGATLGDGDGDHDLAVDVDDLTLWQSEFGLALPLATAVPEPSGVWLSVVGSAAVLFSRRRRVA